MVLFNNKKIANNSQFPTKTLKIREKNSQKIF